MAGQIISRGKDKWLVRVFLGRDENGKRKYHNKTIHGNKKEAQKYLNAVLREKDLGTFREPSNITVDEYLTNWMETSAKQRLRPRTYAIYEDYLRIYIRPAIGKIKIDKLTPLHIQSLYNQMKEKGLSASTIKKAHSIISAAFNQAVKWKTIAQNPAQHVDLPQIERNKMRALTPEEAKRFLEAASSSRWFALFTLMLTTGMRPGEALGLKWSDIEDDKIHVQHSLVTRGKGWSLTEPKTSRSRRTIPMPISTVKVLQQHKTLQNQERLVAGPEYHNHNFVFASYNGEPLNIRNVVNRHFKPILKEAGLPETIRLYDLRHTCATLLLKAGENPKVVSERLGHASVVMTLDVYSHVLPDMQKKAAEKLENMLFG
jgi:integrase